MKQQALRDIYDSQSVISVIASPGNLLKMQIIGLNLRIFGDGAQSYVF